MRKVGSHTLSAVVASASVLALVGALRLSVAGLAAIVAFVTGKCWWLDGRLWKRILLADLGGVLLAAFVHVLVLVLHQLLAVLAEVEFGLHVAGTLVRVRREYVCHVCDG